MACIVLEHNGVMRLIEEGQPYRLEKGERISGIDKTCNGASIIPVTPHVHTLQDELSREVGPGFGDWIKTLASPIATVLGKKGCSTCEARRIVTNAYGQLKARHGQLAALAAIKDLWALSYRTDGDRVLVKLKEMLND